MGVLVLVQSHPALLAAVAEQGPVSAVLSHGVKLCSSARM